MQKLTRTITSQRAARIRYTHRCTITVRQLPGVIATVSNVKCRVSWRSLVSYRWLSHFLRNIHTRRVLVPTCAPTAATSFRSKLLPILLQHLVTNLLGPRLVAKAVSTIHVRLHVNPDVNRGHVQLLPRRSQLLSRPTVLPFRVRF